MTKAELATITSDLEDIAALLMAGDERNALRRLHDLIDALEHEPEPEPEPEPENYPISYDSLEDVWARILRRHNPRDRAFLEGLRIGSEMSDPGPRVPGQEGE